MLVLSKTEGGGQRSCIIVHCENAQPEKQSSHTTTHELSAREGVSQSLNQTCLDIQGSDKKTQQAIYFSHQSSDLSCLVQTTVYSTVSFNLTYVKMMMAGGSSIDTSPKIGGG